MKVEVRSRVSDEFYEQVKRAVASFPSYYDRLNTTIALAPRIKNIFPDMRSDWHHLGMMHRGATNTIGLSEYRRSPSALACLGKNVRIVEAIAHETGHAFDLRGFGDGENMDYFSLKPDQPFLKAWKADLADLLKQPELYSSLDIQFQRHMEPDGRGTKETFAEIWANAHGHSALAHVGIDDIRPYFPECTAVVEDCVRSLG